MTVKHILFFSFLLIFFTSIQVTAQIRYVSKTGSSTYPYTSWETAADSIQKAINASNHGDTIIVANGVYKEALFINKQLTLLGSSMDSTVIDGRGLSGIVTDWAIIEVRQQQVVFENFNFYGKGEGNNRAILAGYSAILIVRNSKFNFATRAISAIQATLLAENLIITNNVDGGIIFSSDNNNCHINNCIMIITNENGYGIRISFSPYANILINNNILLFNGIRNSEFGIALGAASKVYIYNNIISGFLRNIDTDIVTDTAFIFNNIISRNQRNFVSVWSSGMRQVMRNNIFLKNHIAVFGDARVKLNYNIFWKNIKDLENVSYGDKDMVVDPMFVNDTLPWLPEADFHLQAFSPAIDAGDPAVLDIDGTRSDIGMYGGQLGKSYKYIDLAPKSPRNLKVVIDSNLVTLKWNKNTEADTSHYNVYRDTTVNFIIDTSKLVSSPKDTFLVLTNPVKPAKYVYKITCVDKQGNESSPSEEIVIDLTSLRNEYPVTVYEYYLYQNYPNPFNPVTKIGYKLAEGGRVRLLLYDINGRIIDILVNEEKESGYYEYELDAGNYSLSSGIYLYRIEVIGEGKIPQYSDMKKMMLIK